MVVIFACATADTGTEQERTASPSTCTVHAPHCATPQPYFVPVRPTCSRITQSRGVVGSTSTSWDLPLIVRRILDPPVLVPPADADGAISFCVGKYEPNRPACHYPEIIMRCSKQWVAEWAGVGFGGVKSPDDRRRPSDRLHRAHPRVLPRARLRQSLRLGPARRRPLPAAQEAARAIAGDDRHHRRALSGRQG